MGLSGPEIGRALARIRVAFLDGGVRTREEALALAREIASTPAPAGGGASGPSSLAGPGSILHTVCHPLRPDEPPRGVA